MNRYLKILREKFLTALGYQSKTRMLVKELPEDILKEVNKQLLTACLIEKERHICRQQIEELNKLRVNKIEELKKSVTAKLRHNNAPAEQIVTIEHELKALETRLLTLEQIDNDITKEYKANIVKAYEQKE